LVLLVVVGLLAGCANSLSHQQLAWEAAGEPTVSSPAAPAAAESRLDAQPEGTQISVVPPKSSAPPARAAAVPGKPSTRAVGGGVVPTSPDAAPTNKVPSAAPAPASAPTGCTAARSPVVLGAVGQLTGPLGAAFIGGTHAVQAWLALQNAAGGLGCHPVRYVTADDGGDPARHLALLRRLVEQDHVIAMLFQTALLTGEAGRDYLQSKGIPVIGQEGGELEVSDSPIYFNHATSGAPLFDFTAIAGGRVAKARGLSKVGTLTCQEVVACKTADDAWVAQAPKLGLQVVYRGKASLLNVDFTSQCLAAKNAGVQVLGLAFESTGIHRIAQSCASVGYKPLLVCTSVQSTPDFSADPNLDGVVIAEPLLPWFLTDRPAIKQYQGILRRFAPGLAFDSSSINGWTAAMLFSRAAPAFTADTVTSDAIIKALDTVRNDDLGGLTYPLSFTPGKSQAQRACGWIVQVQGAAFTSDGQRFCG
jgi:ABC-type branched-subunit amino acid transport system substrate-binding protein